MRIFFRFIAVLGTAVSIHFFVFWIVAGLFFSANPNSASLIANTVAVTSAALVWRLWPKSKNTLGNKNKALESNFISRIAFCSIIAGSIGFAGGFFGPILLSPGSNQGPLLGILVTGPLGVLLGPVIGVATLVHKTNLESLPKAWRWLAVSWVLSSGFYALSGGGFIMAAKLSVGLMVLSFIVGVALIVHIAKSLQPPEAVNCYNLIILAGGLVMIFISVFPPVVEPSWGSSMNSTGAPLPMFASIFDAGFDASHRVPLYATNLPLWFAEMLITIVLMGIAYVVIRKMKMAEY